MTGRIPGSIAGNALALWAHNVRPDEWAGDEGPETKDGGTSFVTP